jgi:hypothetical protein
MQRVLVIYHCPADLSSQEVRLDRALATPYTIEASGYIALIRTPSTIDHTGVARYQPSTGRCPAFAEPQSSLRLF